jgi:Rad3-related DNA helicase
LINLKEKKNILIQSPTGTGKTMSLLCSTLAWAMEQQDHSKAPPPQIIYASRTHAQLKQVVNEINKLCYQVKIAILSSRDQACANEDLKLLRGQDKELECRLRIAQRRGLDCKFYKVSISLFRVKHSTKSRQSWGNRWIFKKSFSKENCKPFVLSTMRDIRRPLPTSFLYPTTIFSTKKYGRIRKD